MKADELYDEYRKCGEKYWSELSHDEVERWERVAKVVDRLIDTEIGRAYMDGWNDGAYGD